MAQANGRINIEPGRGMGSTGEQPSGVEVVPRQQFKGTVGLRITRRVGLVVEGPSRPVEASEGIDPASPLAAPEPSTKAESPRGFLGSVVHKLRRLFG